MDYIKKIKIDNSIYNIYDNEALHDATAFDEAGAANAVIGSEADEATANTVYGAKAYTDEKIALLLNNSSDAVDSIMELAVAMEENEDVVDALEAAIGGKAEAVHNHDDIYYTEVEIESRFGAGNVLATAVVS